MSSPLYLTVRLGHDASKSEKKISFFCSSAPGGIKDNIFCLNVVPLDEIPNAPFKGPDETPVKERNKEGGFGLKFKEGLNDVYAIIFNNGFYC